MPLTNAEKVRRWQAKHPDYFKLYRRRERQNPAKRKRHARAEAKRRATNRRQAQIIAVKQILRSAERLRTVGLTIGKTKLS